MSAPKRGRPSTGLGETKLLVHSPRWLREAMQEAARRLGVSEAHAWRAAALLWLSRDGRAEEKP